MALKHRKHTSHEVMVDIGTLMANVQHLLSEQLPGVQHEHQLDFHGKTSLNTDQKYELFCAGEICFYLIKQFEG